MNFPEYSFGFYDNLEGPIRAILIIQPPPCQGPYGQVWAQVPGTCRVSIQLGMLSCEWHDHNAVLNQHIGRDMVGVWNRACKTESGQHCQRNMTNTPGRPIETPFGCPRSPPGSFQPPPPSSRELFAMFPGICGFDSWDYSQEWFLETLSFGLLNCVCD